MKSLGSYLAALQEVFQRPFRLCCLITQAVPLSDYLPLAGIFASRVPSSLEEYCCIEKKYFQALSKYSHEKQRDS